MVDLVFVPVRFVNDLFARFVAVGLGFVGSFASDLFLFSESALVSLAAEILSLLESSLAMVESAGVEAEESTFVILRFVSDSGSDKGPNDGVFGTLLSATVSSREFDVLAPLAGLLNPVEGVLISSSVSCVSIKAPRSGADRGASRLSEVFDWLCSASIFLAMLTALLAPLNDGGGDLNRGDVGQEGE